MAEICELVVSQKGNPKLVVNGYLIVKKKVIGNTYYWCCEKRKSECCKGQAITTFSNNLHYLKKFIKHKNHAPEASSSDIAKVIANNIATIPLNLSSYMPTHEALRMRIKWIRSAKTLPQPQTLEEINIPALLCLTLNRELFLIKDLEINQNKILPQTIITDFEQATIHASSDTFPGIVNKGCFFHLGKNLWKKIQNEKLVVQYGTN
ncbi:18246_t:CDS:2 [Dentiscutata erythropus]|uniref:18246_t:CDS:1 n=1 Tax=Dentiscutata erythropus TaxID=1348616 RepID=A0A9N9P9I0_9GLOM|nr:18246_t:CDS:2 [Dentiscutata erythropus]